MVAFTPPAGVSPGVLAVGFAGLTGPNGILPQHYTTLVMSRLRAKDTTLRDFLDLFHHRLLSLLYRAWRRRSLALLAEQARRVPDAGRRVLLALSGFAPPAVAARAPAAVVPAAGLFAHRTRTAAGLRAVLAGAFGLPIRVETFAGQWLYLDAESRGRLPVGDGPPAVLGRNVVLGRRVWDRQGMVRVVVGPVAAADFRALGNRGRLRPAFAHLARTYCGAKFDIEVRVLLLAAAVPWSVLGHATGPRLGRDGWLRAHQLAAPAADAVFRVGGEKIYEGR